MTHSAVNCCKDWIKINTCRAQKIAPNQNEEEVDCGGRCQNSCDIPSFYFILAGVIVFIILVIALLQYRAMK